MRRIGVSGVSGFLALTAASAASAQEAPVAPSAISLTGPPAAAAAAPVIVVAAPAKDAVVAEGGNDHDLFVHHIAVGYFGVSQLPVGQAGGSGSSTVNAPVVGVRYWATRMVGIDAGIGFGYYSNAVNGTTGNSDDWGVALHGGLPLAIADSKHFSFEIVPIELNLGFTGGNPTTPNTSVHGLRVDVGGRVGAELHFGFIGIPQLALEGSLGLYFQHESWSSTTTGSATSPGGSSNTFATSVGSDPWAIFTDTISALYYF